jgi:hypothetical protein
MKSTLAMVRNISNMSMNICTDQIIFLGHLGWDRNFLSLKPRPLVCTNISKRNTQWDSEAFIPLDTSLPLNKGYCSFVESNRTTFR